jgi:hypothetical protein
MTKSQMCKCNHGLSLHRSKDGGLRCWFNVKFLNKPQKRRYARIMDCCECEEFELPEWEIHRFD